MIKKGEMKTSYQITLIFLILLILITLLKYNLVFQIVKGSYDFHNWRAKPKGKSEFRDISNPV